MADKKLREINWSEPISGKECFHSFLIPIEYVYGTRRWNNGKSYIDWTSNVINAHISRVTKVYCPSCGYQFDIPTDAEDE